MPAIQNQNTIKCVAIGDGAVGKTCMLITYTTDGFPGEYVPTVFDNYAANITVKGRSINLSLWDTAGQEDYDRLRVLSYPQTDVFVICYSCTDRTTFDNIKNKWYLEITQHFPADKIPPVLIVGTKSDLEDENGVIIKDEEVNALVSEINASKAMKCSALTKAGLHETFNIACELGLEKKNAKNTSKKKSRCTIL